MGDTTLVLGFHAIRVRLRHDPASVRKIYVRDGRRDARMRSLVEQARGHGIAVHAVDAGRLDALAGSAKHQGVVAVAEPAEGSGDLGSILRALSEAPLILVLDGVQDPHNLGACLRSADAFGAHAVVAPRDRAAGLSPAASKAASGAAATVPYLPVVNLARTLENLKAEGIWLVGTAADAETELSEAPLAGPLALVLGGEGAGLRALTRKLCDVLVRIPMRGTVESLNVSATAAICLYETRRQRDEQADRRG